MSQVIKGVATAALILGALTVATVFAPAGIAAFLGSAAVWGVAETLAVSAILSGVVSQLTANRRPPTPSLTANYVGTVEPRRIIYGQVQVGGMETLPPLTSGTNNKNLHEIITIAGHEINAITAVYFGQDTVGTLTAITGSANDGKVTTGAYANKAWVRGYLGTSTQAADFILDNALTAWTSAHQGKGVAYVAIQYEVDETVYKTGKPQPTVLVQGKKVYDPRQDSTNGGSGSQRLATPSTWTYSANPALCLADYLIDDKLGLGEITARVDYAMVATAADHCDELVAIPTASTQKRYTCNCAIYTTTAYELNIAAIAGAMLGSCIYSGGQWRMWAGVWIASSFQIADANVVESGIDLATAYPYKERWNGVRGTFINPAMFYAPDDFPPTQDATYVTADGESVFKDLRLDACTNVYEAQRAAILLTRKSRNKRSATIRCDMSLFRVRPGETGIVTIAELGWSSKTVRCEGWKFNPRGFVELTIREELSSDWNDPLEADYLTPLAITTPTPVYFTPDAPSSMTSVATPKGPLLSWTAPAIVPAGSEYEIWEYTASTPFASATKVWSGRSTSVTIQKSDTIVRYYWVVLRMANGVASTNFPSGAGISGQGYALVDFAYVATGQCVLTDNTIAKIGGAALWDSQVYSAQGYRNGAYVSFRPAQTNLQFMIALNGDPATDSSYTSLDYALYATSVGTLQRYENGASIEVFGSYSAGDDLSIVYDGAIVRYFQNAALLREVMVGPDRTFYLDSSFADPGAAANDVRFGPYGQAVPVLYIARGGCIVSDTNAQKPFGIGAWDSDVVSLKGYAVCHVAFKANDTAHDLMIGLSAVPLSSLSYTTIDFAWFCNGSGVLYIYESSAPIATFGTYNAATVLAITYDSTTVQYWKDGVSVRSVALSNATLYLDSSFNSPGAGVNSLRFGPTTNLAVADTSQLGANAATQLAIAQASGVSITQNSHTPVWTQSAVSVTLTPLVTCVLRCNATGLYTFVNPNASTTNMRMAVADSTAPPWIYDTTIPASTTVQGNFAQTQNINCTAGVPITIYAGFARMLSSETLTIVSVDLSVEEIRR